MKRVEFVFFDAEAGIAALQRLCEIWPRNRTVRGTFACSTCKKNSMYSTCFAK
jgi:hypothetical protein